MGAIKAAIFDLDGVIVDTAKYHYLAWKKLANSLGIDFTEHDNEKLKGVSRVRSLEIILEIGKKTLKEEEKTSACDKKNQWYLEYIQELQPEEILPEVVPFLTYLRKNGIKISLGSASKNSVMILEKLRILNLFDAIIDGNKVSRAKPDPEVFTAAGIALNVPPENCVVFEDAQAGVQAGKNAGMMVIGIGEKHVLTEADMVIKNFAEFNFNLLTGEATSEEYVLTEIQFTGENVELNGSKFLLGNGYAGCRGTLEEYKKEQKADFSITAEKEPVHVPNAFFVELTCGKSKLNPLETKPETHVQKLDIKKAIHSRETVFKADKTKITVKAERFLSLDNIHLMVMKYSFTCDQADKVVIMTGNAGDYLKNVKTGTKKNQILSSIVTGEGESLAVAELLEFSAGKEEIVKDGNSIYRNITVQAEAGREYTFYKYVSIYSSHDGVKDIEESAIENNEKAQKTGYQVLSMRHAQLWNERWVKLDVKAGGEFASRYSLYQLLLAGINRKN